VSTSQLEDFDLETEQRKSPRSPMRTEIACRCAGREYVLLSRDVSTGGFGAQYEAGFVATSEIGASFQPGPEYPQIACRCRVVYSLEGRGIGVEFIELSEQSRRALEKFVDAAN
jgi:c-di-GMP-binding flagellar brake protein YcgR